MKNIFALIAVAILFSCNNKEVSSTTTASDPGKVQTRYLYNQLMDSSNLDESINSSNSYSNLFLDTARMGSFIRSSKLSDQDEKAFRNFYNRRNYQYAWITSDGLTEQGRGFWNLYTYDDDSSQQKINKSLLAGMDTLAEKDSFTILVTDSAMMRTEMMLTKEFIGYLQNNPHKVFNSTADINQFIPARKNDVVLWTEKILNRPDSTGQVPPAYSKLKQYLRKYYEIAKQGGWQRIDSSIRQLKKGTSSPAVIALKKRFHLTGELKGNDTSAVFNDSLESIVRKYQQTHGLKQTGMVTDSMVRVLNIPVEHRMKQILVNMNRMLWMPAMDTNQVVVNIPAFRLVVNENGQKAFDMDVIVGREGWNTMMFNGNLNQVVFSPYWNVPSSIVKEEILPAMKANKNYLKSKNMEIIKQSDTNPVIRQLPGAGNALGRVKFLFPNSYDIYLHDTEAKHLFNRKNKAISHGCIRLADAEKMANYLLRNDPSWTPEKIKAAMSSGKEQYVKLKQAVPVAITYFTVWVDDNGQLNFYDDVYGNDERTAVMMFTNNNTI